MQFFDLTEDEKSIVKNTSNIFFIRHSSCSDYSEFIKDQIIGIHFNNKHKNLTFEDLKKNSNKGHIKTAINCLENLSANGGIVFAKYNVLINGEQVQKIEIGFVLKNTKIEEKIYALSLDSTIKSELIKFLKYVSLGSFFYSMAPILSIYGGRSTFAKYDKSHIFYKILKQSLLLGETIKGDVSLIHPRCLEQLCVEWLRQFGDRVFQTTLDYCFTGIGHTLPVIDFAGKLKNGTKLFAQVTYSDSNEIRNKVVLLTGYVADREKSVLVMFCKKNDHIVDDRVVFIDIDRVISDFIMNNKQSLLNDFVGIKNIEWHVLNSEE